LSIYPQARFLLSVNGLQQLPEDTGAEVAFAGRSNAGKSSAINVITQRRGLARSSKTPGRTQLLNLFELEPDRRLVDLPGYGYAKVPVQMQVHWQELVGSYLQVRASLSGLFLIVDARRGMQSEERELVDWAQARVLTMQTLLSKSDKLTRNEGRLALKDAQQQLAGRASVQLFSAVNKQGVEEAREALQAMLAKSTPVERGAAPPG
jgi:GTP-binding protein